MESHTAQIHGRNTIQVQQKCCSLDFTTTDYSNSKWLCPAVVCSHGSQVRFQPSLHQIVVNFATNLLYSSQTTTISNILQSAVKTTERLQLGMEYDHSLCFVQGKKL